MRPPTQVDELQNVVCPLISVITPLYSEKVLLPYLILIRERSLLAWSDRLGIFGQLQIRKNIFLLARIGPEPWLSLTIAPV
jgi:hypothetical protein